MQDGGPLLAHSLSNDKAAAKPVGALINRPFPDAVGFDVAAALARIDGDAEAYREFLTVFRDVTTDGINAMVAAMSRNDVEVARLEAHSLKGSAGSVGAVGLQAAAALLEKSLKDAVIDRELLAAVEAEWKQAQESLASLLS